MENKITTLQKLSLSAVYSFIKIYFLGIGSLTVSFFAGITILLHSTSIKGAHSSGQSGIIALFASAPLQSILLLLILLSLFFIVTFAANYVVQKIVYKIVQEKSENTIIPTLDKIIQQCRKDQQSELKSIRDFNLAKKRLIQYLQGKQENKWIKKIIFYYLRKLKINESQLNLADKDLFELIRQKVIDSLNSISSPRKTAFWILIAIHWVCVLLIYLS